MCDTPASTSAAPAIETSSTGSSLFRDFAVFYCPSICLRNCWKSLAIKNEETHNKQSEDENATQRGKGKEKTRRNCWRRGRKEQSSMIVRLIGGRGLSSHYLPHSRLISLFIWSSLFWVSSCIRDFTPFLSRIKNFEDFFLDCPWFYVSPFEYYFSLFVSQFRVCLITWISQFFAALLP